MKTIFVPDYRDKNLYQTNLSDSLSTKGVSICFGGRIIKSIIKHRPDILHIHWPNPFMVTDSKVGTVAKSIKFICELSLLKLFGVKIIWTVHNIVGHEGKFKSIELLFSKFLARLCDRLIVHCPSAKIEVEKIYGKNCPIAVIPHGNYIGQYKNDITISEARNKLKLGEDIVFLYFGQIRPYKGVSELISAFKRLDYQQAKLLIVGKPLDDDIALDILDSCKDDGRIINILKFIPDEDIQTYMNASDVVVLPYKNVLTSGAAILAMSFGKAVIAPAVKCIADTLDEKGSFLYSTSVEDGLFEAMDRAIEEDRDTITNMGIYNLKLAEKFSWDGIAEKTYDIYKECVEG